MNENEQNNNTNEENDKPDANNGDIKAFDFKWTDAGSDGSSDAEMKAEAEVEAESESESKSESETDVETKAGDEISSDKISQEDGVQIPNSEKEPLKNRVLLTSSIISACSILLLLVFAASLVLGIFPIAGRDVVLVGVSDLGATNAEEDASPELIEDFLNSVVLIKTETESGSGTASGVIISKDGYILTNHHVIEDALTVYVQLYGENISIKADIVGFHKNDDVAVLKIKRDGLRAATFARSEEVRHGEKVYAIGNPKSTDYAWSVTQGIISSPLRELKVYNSDGVLERKTVVVQTDASVNNGNSGGPLINVRGEVVGIVTLKRADSTGLGFALPANGVLIDAASIIEKGHADNVNSGITLPRPLLGITGVGVQAKTYYRNVINDGQSAIEQVEKEYAEANPSKTFYAEVTGVYISDISTGSDAEKYLKTGDIITEVNGMGVSTIYGVMNVVNEFNGGDKITVKYYRNGNYETAVLTLKTSTDIG